MRLKGSIGISLLICHREEKVDEDIDGARGKKKKKIKIVMPKGETTESEQDKSVVVLEKKKHSKKSKDVKKKPRTPESVEDIHSKHSNRGKTYRVEEGSSGPSKVDQKKGKEKVYDTETEVVMVGALCCRQVETKKEIVCRDGTLKVTPGLIHKLWGIPIGGIQVESIVPLETYDASVAEWRAQFEGRLLATRTLVERIESAEDEDTFDFQMNFIMLFMTVLVEYHKKGRVREGILRYITAETDYSQIDWCNYVFESIKSCKLGWSPDDNSSLFNGPLAILTVCFMMLE
ncbi:hypothetical protein R6Q59_011893 [Mikania micrantha]